MSVDQVAKQLKSGAVSPDQLPISIIKRNGEWYTLNNRSLKALQGAGMQPTRVIDVTW